ncbi:type VI secretion system Vgr family protein [Polyangium aurulentum]|uniref:type VI secretion system Vgr family protein n=1 Tax=Polyangium aurulentum TaxID=2567896 RepID=UPI00146EFA5D|nr:type VI secretion system tip protein TssI/VgrG [Polyangium aurulentum]UQA57639.1 type VI secretion system tip protein VgrG [Polyangium aurulentum]
MPNVDFSFASEATQGPDSPWGHLQVVRFHGQEAISEPYRYELTLFAKAPAAEIDPRDLLGKRATLRIATQSSPTLKVVHGILVEAEELDELPEGMLYRVILVPPWVRAMHRKRCRIFLGKTLRQIVDAVLQDDPLMELRAGAEVQEDEGEPGYAPAAEAYTWRVGDTSRLDDARVRSFVVQYNESDFAFVSRLLEEEGISYHFEGGKDTCLLVLTDQDAGRAHLAPDLLGAAIPGRKVDSVKLGARLRPASVVLDDYNWKKPKLDMAASAGGGADGALVEYHYPGGYPDAPGQGKPLALARVDRYRVEASYAVGAGSVRVLAAGSVFKLEHDDPGYEGEYVVSRLDVRAEQQGVLSQPSGDQALPWTARFELARRGGDGESHFRPALLTPKPRIRGTQSAVVTADPGASGAEVNVGGPDGISVGCVRLKFRWDTDKARLAKEPSSTWVRVSQVFAGAGEGAVWHPRVGDEVLVDFEEGDPDRPVVVGRVYNGANLPARSGAPESSLKSLSTPGGGTYNEIMFGDSAGGEMLHYFAGKDQTTDVANFRRESIAANATMIVGGNNTESIGGNRTESVGANDSLTIGGNQMISIGGNSTTIIGGNLVHSVGANELNMVGGSQTINVGANITETVAGAVLESYGASRTTTVGGAVTENFGATMTVSVGANVDEKCATHSLDVGAARLMTVGGNMKTVVSGSNTTTVSSMSTEKSGGPQNMTVGGSITRNGPLHVTSAAFEKDITQAKIDALGGVTTASVIAIKVLGMLREVNGAKKTSEKVKPEAIGSKHEVGSHTTKFAAICFIASGADGQIGGPNVDV